MDPTLPIAYCKRQLARIWFAGGGVLFFILVLQTLFNRYGDDALKVWGWLLPNVLPTLSLILGQLVLDAMQSSGTDKRMDRFLFRLTEVLSCAYLLSLVLIFALQPFLTMSPLVVMQQSSVYLGPLQGLVAGAMGAFFVKAAKDGHGPQAAVVAAVAREEAYQREKEREKADQD